MHVSPRQRTMLRLLAASLVLVQVAAAHEAQIVSPLPQHPLAFAGAPSEASTSNVSVDDSSSFHIVSAGSNLLDRIGRMLGSILHDVPDESSIGNDDGLFGGDGSTLAWGGSTIEVVKTQASYLTRPATFGPRVIDEEGLRGTLLPISDFYHRKGADKKDDATTENVGGALTIDNSGCPYKGGPGWRDNEEHGGGELAPGHEISVLGGKSSDKPKDWIALVERGGGCSFVAKVRVSQELGAKAVVVGDAPSPDHEHDGPLDNDPGLSGRLVTMFAPGDTSDVLIPSTFITRPSYVDLIRLVQESSKEDREECVARKKAGQACKDDPSGVQVILWRDDVMWEWPLIDFAFVLLMLPSFMTLITIIVHRIRMIRQRRKERAPEVAVLNLPCLIWRGNGQPWEKVEEAALLGGAGASAEGSSVTKGKPLSRLTAFVGRLRRRSQDMELGDTADDAAPVPQPDTPNEAGPSSSAATQQPPIALKTTPVAPPRPPPDRMYYSCDECAICLSDFVDGDMVRVLPCGHVFHLPEIDSWLLRVKKLCPICKRDIEVPPAPPVPSLQPTAAPAPVAQTEPQPEPNVEEQDENAPLLNHRDV